MHPSCKKYFPRFHGAETFLVRCAVLSLRVTKKNAIMARKFNSDAEGLKVRESSGLQERHIILANSFPSKSQVLVLICLSKPGYEQETRPWLWSGAQLYIPSRQLGRGHTTLTSCEAAHTHTVMSRYLM